MTYRCNEQLGKKRTEYKKILADKYGPRFSDYRKKWDSSYKLEYTPDFPLEFDLDTIDACNLACKYCNSRVNFPRTPKNVPMPESLIRRIFEEATDTRSKDKLSAVNLGYLGEPLLNAKIIPDIFNLSYEAGVMESFIHTNGQLLTEQNYRMLADHGLTHLLISIDTINPETYRDLRRGDLEPVLTNIHKILDIREADEALFPLIHINFMNSSETQSEKQNFIDYWDKKVDFIEIQTFVNWNNLIGHQTITAKCPQPWQRLGITVAGDLIPCCSGIPDISLEEHRLGSLDETTIYDAWNSEKIKELRKEILELKFSRFRYCKECHIRCQYS